MLTHTLPDSGYLRIRQILGNPNANPPVPALIPVCASTWWSGVRAGRYPRPVKLSPNTTAWRVEDIRDLMDRIDSGNAWESARAG